MKFCILLLLVPFMAGCAIVSVQTGTNGAVVTDENIKGGIVVKPRERDVSPPTKEKQ